MLSEKLDKILEQSHNAELDNKLILERLCKLVEITNQKIIGEFPYKEGYVLVPHCGNYIYISNKYSNITEEFENKYFVKTKSPVENKTTFYSKVKNWCKNLI